MSPRLALTAESKDKLRTVELSPIELLLVRLWGGWDFSIRAITERLNTPRVSL